MRIQENLDGIWRFGFYGEERPRPPFCPEDVAPVPGCFDLLEPYCGRRGTAVYVRSVRTGGLNLLDFDGIGLEGEVFWDQHSIGRLKYAYMPEQLVFEAGEEGEHELAVVLDNRYTDAFEPFFDFYGYGGFYGNVTLTRLPQIYLDRIQVSTEDYRHGEIRVQAAASQSYTGDAQLVFDTGYCCSGRFEKGVLDMRVILPSFNTWSPARPCLHQLTMNAAEDSLSVHFGIRQVETCKRQILLNGEPLKLIGVNRHESQPEVGAAMPPAMIAADLRMLKEAGYNFVRGAHYPQRAQTLELCDRLGLLVWEETLGWGMKGEKLHSPEYASAQIEQAEKLTLAHFNHPCIIIKGFLNENASEDPATREIIGKICHCIRSVDQHALISYASNRYEKDVCLDLVDVVSMNAYPGWYDSNYENQSTVHNVEPVLQELSRNMPADKPLLLSECGAEALMGFRDPLESYWSEEYQANHMMAAMKYILGSNDWCGIAIWHFADTRSYINGPHIYYRPRGFNNKGLLDEYRRPKLAWTNLRNLLAQARTTDKNEES